MRQRRFKPAYYKMEKRAVIAVVNYNGKILLGKKRRDSPKVLAGEWHILGETVEDGETDEEALKRGVMQEANLEITVGRYLGSHITPTNKREAKWYECFANTYQVKPGSDLEDIQWAYRNEVLDICGLRASSWPQEIKDYFKA